MSEYIIVFKPSVEKDLRKISGSNQLAILEKVDNLAKDPFPSNSAKLTGTERSHRIRIGNYRVIYEVDPNSRKIIILYIRHRRDVYRKCTS